MFPTLLRISLQDLRQLRIVCLQCLFNLEGTFFPKALWCTLRCKHRRRFLLFEALRRGTFTTSLEYPQLVRFMVCFMALFILKGIVPLWTDFTCQSFSFPSFFEPSTFSRFCLEISSFAVPAIVLHWKDSPCWLLFEVLLFSCSFKPMKFNFVETVQEFIQNCFLSISIW